MISAKALRAAVLAEIPLLIGGMVLMVWLWDAMPPELAEYQDNQTDPLTDETGSPVLRGALVVYLLVGAGSWIGGLIGLVQLRKWGAWLYLISLVLFLPSYFIFGYVIVHPAEQIYYDVHLMVSGGILALAFFSDALPWKGRKPELL